MIVILSIMFGASLIMAISFGLYANELRKQVKDLENINDSLLNSIWENNRHQILNDN